MAEAQSPGREVVLAYPVPEVVRCPRCWRSEDTGLKSRGEFRDPATLAKHQKREHPRDSITYNCSVCKFRGTGRYPRKSAKEHYDRMHGSPSGGPGGGARGGGSCAAGSSPSASGGSRRGRAADSRRPRLRSTASTSTAPPPPAATTSSPGAESPSYAAVAATETPATRSPPTTAEESAAPRGTSVAVTTGRAHPQESGGSVKTRPKRGAANRSDLSAAANKNDLSAAANRRSPSVAARETRGAPRISPVGPRTRSRRAPPTLPTTPEGATPPPGPSGLQSVSLGKSDGQCAASTSRCAGGAQGPARTPPLQRGTPPPAQVTPGLSPSTRDSPEVICLDTPPSMPATSLPATLTTTTVTTVACGGPIMSTLGLPTGGHITLPRPSPTSDTQQTPPGAVWVTPMERTPIPSGKVERRQQGAATPSPPPPPPS